MWRPRFNASLGNPAKLYHRYSQSLMICFCHVSSLFISFPRPFCQISTEIVGCSSSPLKCVGTGHEHAPVSASHIAMACVTRHMDYLASAVYGSEYARGASSASCQLMKCSTCGPYHTLQLHQPCGPAAPCIPAILSQVCLSTQS
jgi:hypothetical protein